MNGGDPDYCVGNLVTDLRRDYARLLDLKNAEMAKVRQLRAALQKLMDFVEADHMENHTPIIPGPEPTEAELKARIAQLELSESNAHRDAGLYCGTLHLAALAGRGKR
jgi:hypothetical protein